MSRRVRLDEAQLTAVARGLLEAGSGLRNRRLVRPRSFPTVSGAGGDVERYLANLSLARALLADAAHSASISAAELLRESSELDAAIAAAMPGGFLLRTGDR